MLSFNLMTLKKVQDQFRASPQYKHLVRTSKDWGKPNNKQDQKYTEQREPSRFFSMASRDRVIVLIVVLLTIFSIAYFVVRPAVVGYGVYDDIQSSGLSSVDYTDQLVALDTRITDLASGLNSCNDLTSGLRDEIKTVTSKLDVCEDDRNSIRYTLASVRADRNTEADELRSDLRNKDTLVESLKYERDVAVAALEEEKGRADSAWTDYNTIAKNTAKNICCKKKVDDRSISGFVIIDNMVSCVSSGGTSISCE